MKENNISGQTVCRFNDIEVLRYIVSAYDVKCESNDILKRKLLLYYLAKATLAGRDIYFDQNGKYNLYIRTLFERIYLHYDGDRTAKDFLALTDYLYNIWFANGIHHHYGEHKLTPKFSKEYFKGIYLNLKGKGCLDLMPKVAPNYDTLERLLFDQDYMSKRTVQDGSKDLITASSVNFYSEEITQKEAEEYYRLQRKDPNASYNVGLNSKLYKDKNGEIKEAVWCAKGLYSEHIEEIVANLTEAMQYSTSEKQREATEYLINYYKTGDLKLFDKYSIKWVQDKDFSVDFINGFIETYQDPLAMKGSWEGLVEVYDREASHQTELLASHAAWFEEHAPIDDLYKKSNPKGVSATVVDIAMLGGDSYPATPIGINLPNADAIRAEYGSKSIRIENIHQAYDDASAHSGLREAFIEDLDVREMLRLYSSKTSRLHTDLHECLGHGSGKLRDGVSPDALGQWHSTIEEARADLFGLYFIADPKMVELGLLPNRDAYKAEYYSYLHNGLVMQLVRIEPGHRIEEAHMRNRALISRYVLEHCEGAVELDGLNLKIYDYEPIRLAVAQLLREIQRIKSEGDSESAAQLIARYAVEVPQHLHHTLLQKYQQLHIAPYKGFVNPKLLVVRDQEGKVSDIVPSYHEAYDEQMLRYSRDYSAKGANYDVSPWSIKDQEPSEAILEEAKSIRKSLLTRMDGVVASNMREYGLSYKYNFGMTRSHLDDIAKEVEPSTQLAQYLWSREVRELRLIALRIWPIEEISSNELLSLALQCEGKAELADEFVALLMDRVPNAHYLAMTWIESGLGVVSVALNILTRTIRRKIYKPNSVECDYLIRFAISMIEKYVVCDYYIPNAARNFLKSMVGVSKEIANDIIAGMEDLLQRDLRGEVLQIAEELKFESEFVYES